MGVRRAWFTVIVVVAVAASGGTAAALAGASNPRTGGSDAASSHRGAGGTTRSDPMIPAPPITTGTTTPPVATGATVPPSITSTPTTTTAPSTGSTTGTTTPSTTKVAADCDGPASTQDVLSQDPTTIVIACADDGIGLQNLHWTAWGATSATGTGTLRLNLCTPDCADGTIAYYPASVTLSKVVDGSDGPAFTLVSLTYPDAAPTRVTGQVMSQFTLFDPGA